MICLQGFVVQRLKKAKVDEGAIVDEGATSMPRREGKQPIENDDDGDEDGDGD